ncbi:MAG: type II secretion system minor pseudopilin GspI [Pseudomonadota bacterium]
MLTRKRKPSGFTLLEVLIALAVIGITLAALAGKTLQMLDSANAMSERTYADWIAQNKIAELRLSNTLPEVSSSSGEVYYANLDWAWRAVVSETGVENLYRVDVTVNRVIVDGDALSRTVTGFIGEPTPPGQSNRFWATGSRTSGEIQ